VKRYHRAISEKEKRRLRNELPWFGRRRKEGFREIEAGLVEVHEFQIGRIWNINGCQPPCCPYTLLFRTADGLFVYVETWQEIERQNNDLAESTVRIESTPASRKIINVAVEGEARIGHTEALRQFNEVFEISGDAEWQIYKTEELPDGVRAILESV
jgi:hypothetical protein